MNEKDKVRDEVYAEINFHASYEPMRCVRTDNYKYIKVFHEYRNPMLGNIDNSSPKKNLIDNGFEEYVTCDEYLFNLVFDPYERENVVRNKKYDNILKQMRGKLEGFMEGTNDILLDAEMKIPSGIALNDPSAKSPKDNPRVIR